MVFSISWEFNFLFKNLRKYRKSALNKNWPSFQEEPTQIPSTLVRTLPGEREMESLYILTLYFFSQQQQLQKKLLTAGFSVDY